MSIPITIEGQKYFVTIPTLADFRSFKQFLARDLRQKLGESIPSGLSDDELRRRLRLINDECEAIDPFKSMSKLPSYPGGAALLFYAWLRHESPGATLDWVEGLIARCEGNKPAALEGLRELRLAMTSLLEIKKNEIEAARRPKDPEIQPATESPSISTPSTSA